MLAYSLVEVRRFGIAVFVLGFLARSLAAQIAGRVVVGGADPPEPAFVSVNCQGASWAGYTNRKGEFQAVFGRHTDLGNCDVRATLEGFVPGGASVARPDGSEVVITLHPQSTQSTGAVSYSTLAAPPGALRAFDKGIAAERAGRWKSAESGFRKALAEYPGFAEAWSELGFVLARSGETENARDAYSRAIAIDPKVFPAWARYAALEAEQKNWPRVAGLTSAAIGQDPAGWPALFFYNAVANLNLGKLAEAEESARRAIERDKDHEFPRAEYVLGRILAAEGDRIEAVRHMERYLEILPNAADAARVRAEIDGLR